MLSFHDNKAPNNSVQSFEGEFVLAARPNF